MNKSAVKFIDTTSNAISINWETCIGCQSCVKTCNDVAGIGVYSTVEVRKAPYVNQRVPERKFSAVVKLDLENEHTNNEIDRVCIANSDCMGCGQCGQVCPVNAIKPYDGDLGEVLMMLKAKREGVEGTKHTKFLAFVAPSVRIGISELVGLPIGTSVPRQLASALKECGFDYVYDVNWGADLTTVVDTEDTIAARETGENRPTFTSCCPGWVNMAENKYPEILKNLSKACSCVEMAARCARRYIEAQVAERKASSNPATKTSAGGIDDDLLIEDLYVVDIMPCTAKKQEARRAEQTHIESSSGMIRRNIDACLTVPETQRLIQELAPKMLPFQNKDDEEFPQLDAPMGIAMTSTGSSQFARTSGVAENVLRQLSLLKTGDPMKVYDSLVQKDIWIPDPTNEHIGIRSMTCVLDGQEYVAYVAKGGIACVKAVEMFKDGLLKDVDIVEMMVCPGGCLGGGGMPKVRRTDFSKVLNGRITGVRKLDHEVDKYDGRVGGQNKHQLEFIGGYLSSHDVLVKVTETTYTAWDEGDIKHPQPPSPLKGCCIGGLC